MKPAITSFLLLTLLASLFSPIIAPEAKAANPVSNPFSGKSVADFLPNPVGIAKNIAGGACIAAATAIRDVLIAAAESVYITALNGVNKVYGIALSQVEQIKIAAIRYVLKLALQIVYNVARSLLKTLLKQAEGMAQEKFRDATAKCPKGDGGASNCLSLAGLEIGPDGTPTVIVGGAAAECPDIEKLAWDPISKQCVCDNDVLPKQGTCDLSWDRAGNALKWTSEITISDAEKHENNGGTVYQGALSCTDRILLTGTSGKSIPSSEVPSGSVSLIPPENRPDSVSCALTITPVNSSIGQEFSCSASVEKEVLPPT